MRSGVRSAECKWPRGQDHGQPRAGRAAQGGLGLRSPDRARRARRVGSDPARRARAPRRPRRARARREGPPGRRRLRGRGGARSGPACRGSSAPPRRRPKPPSPGSSRCPSGTWPRRSPISAASSCRSRSRPGTASLPQSVLTSPTSTARSGRAARSRSPRPGATTSCSAGRRAPARRCSRVGFPGSCRSLDESASLEVTRIHSVAGILRVEHPLVTTPPFRAPHHTASAAAIVGGGRGPRPGEASLAHHGVLLLDELPEFVRPALEALRQPLEDGVISVARAEGTALYPASFQLVGTMNLCPCGARGDPAVACTCSAQRLTAYGNKLSRALLDRFDLVVVVPRPRAVELARREERGVRCSPRACRCGALATRRAAPLVETTRPMRCSRGPSSNCRSRDADVRASRASPRRSPRSPEPTRSRRRMWRRRSRIACRKS